MEKTESYIAENYLGTNLITSSDTPAEYSSLTLANYYSGEKAAGIYKNFIEKRFPERIFYDIYNNSLKTDVQHLAAKKNSLSD
ncbi:MAG: hypothetical protein ABI462_10665 [Ignavibacteria bacterium]